MGSETGNSKCQSHQHPCTNSPGNSSSPAPVASITSMFSPSFTPTSVIQKMYESREKSKKKIASGTVVLVTIKRILRRPVKRTCCHPIPYPILIKTLLLQQILSFQHYSCLHPPPHCPRPTVIPKNKIIDLKQLGGKHLPWHPQSQEHLFSALPTKFPSSLTFLLFDLHTSFTQD